MNTPKSPWDKSTTIAVFLFVLGFLIGLTQCAPAKAEPEFHFEAGTAIIREPTPSFSAHVVYPGAGPLDSDYEFGTTIFFPSASAEANASLEAQIYTHLWRFDFGLGVAALQNTDRFNGSTMEFALSLRYNISQRWYIVAGHWSNAGTAKPNLGRDAIRVGYKFK